MVACNESAIAGIVGYLGAQVQHWTSLCLVSSCAVAEISSMGIVADALFDGRKLGMLTVMSLTTRGCLATNAGGGLKRGEVVRRLCGITSQRGLLRIIEFDIRSGFIVKMMDRRSCKRGVEFAAAPGRQPTTLP